jgi:hypothetical protein
LTIVTVELGQAHCAVQFSPAKGLAHLSLLVHGQNRERGRGIHGDAGGLPDQIWSADGDMLVGVGLVTLPVPRGFGLGEIKDGNSLEEGG